MNNSISEQVPKITIIKNGAVSNAGRPRHITDTCACWPDGEMAKAKRMLAKTMRITCNDATAYAAMLALSLDLMNHGKIVNAILIKGWQ